jgi:hypothetical protein
VAARRAAQLRELSSAKAAAYRASRHGQVADVVICGRTKGWYQGLTEDYLSVYVSAEGPTVPRFPATLRVSGERVEAERRERRPDGVNGMTA